MVHEFVRAWRVDRRNTFARHGPASREIGASCPRGRLPWAIPIFWGQDDSAGDSVPLLLRECLQPSEPADSCHGYVCETRVSLADASYGVEDNKQAGDCRNDAAASHQTHSTFGVEPAVAHLTDDVALVCPNSRARVGPRPLMMENCRISMLRSLRTFMA